MNLPVPAPLSPPPPTCSPSRLVALLAAFLLAVCCGANAASGPTQQAYVKASNTGIGDIFGVSTAISGDTMVVGAPYECSDAIGINGSQWNDAEPYSGAAYVYVRSSGQWVQQAYLKASNAEVVDFFGWSVAISGDTIIVGAFGESSSATGVNGDQNDNSSYASGAAYIFVRNGSNWSQQAYLKPSNTEPEDAFGISVAVYGDIAVVGAEEEDSAATGIQGDQADNDSARSGAAYVFARSSGQWIQQAYLKASNTAPDDRFGNCVAVSGETVVVGAPRQGESSGAAYVFTRQGTTWKQQALLKASNSGIGDRFACSVGISGDTLVAGAFSEDSSAAIVNGNQADDSTPSAGAAYVFVRNGTNWQQQAYLKASNTGSGGTDYNVLFGYSVAVSSNAVLIGAPNEPSAATGINGNQADYSAMGAGAAYLYTRSGSTWIQQAYLKASNTGPGDGFGFAVAASGTTCVVGAYFEDGDSVGINGNAFSDGASSAGAAYVFDDATSFVAPATLTITPDGSGGQFIRLNGQPNAPYQLLRAPTVIGPWNPIAALQTSPTGFVEYRDQTSPAAQSFYRTLAGATSSVAPATLTITPDGSGGQFIRLNGQPNASYQLLRALTVIGPWNLIATLQTSPTGFVEYRDQSPQAGQSFYRTLGSGQ